MTEKRTHIIHSLKYDIHYRNAKANNQEQVIGQMHHEYMAEKIGKVLDELSPNGEYLHSDKVEIDLGVIRKDDLQNAIEEKIAIEIGRQIQFARESNVPASPESGDSEDKEAVFTISGREGHLIKGIVFFLKNGFFNWQHSGNKRQELHEMINELLIEQPENLLNELKSLFIRELSALQRFLYQIKIIDQNRIIQLMIPEKLEMLQHLDNIPEILLHFTMAESSQVNKFHTKLKALLFQSLLSKNDGLTIDSILKKRKAEVFEILDILPPSVYANKKILSTTKAEDPVLHAIVNLSIDLKYISQSTRKKKQKPKTQFKINKDTERGGKHDKKDSVQQLPHEIDKISIPAGQISQDEELSKGLPAAHGGLILLWPYLNKLFNTFELINDGLFIGENEQTQAIFILNYLAGNTDKPGEDMLLVPKILCGANINTPLPYRYELLPEMKTECNAMLEAAIQNWSAIKATSIKGLQETFLQREALVKQETGHYKFSFERKAMDILIDRLPFGLSLIRMKWINYNIHAIW